MQYKVNTNKKKENGTQSVCIFSNFVRPKLPFGPSSCHAANYTECITNQGPNQTLINVPGYKGQMCGDYYNIYGYVSSYKNVIVTIESIRASVTGTNKTNHCAGLWYFNRKCQ